MPDSDDDPLRKDGGDQRGTGWRPVPDPTSLTTMQLHREIGHLNGIISTQLISMESLMNEKFDGVAKEFLLVERQRVEQKFDAKEALAAALQAAEKAVGEQTTAARKDIDALGARVDTALHGQSDAIGSLTGRVTVMEAVKLGGREQTEKSSMNLGFVVGGFGLILTILTIIVVVSQLSGQ